MKITRRQFIKGAAATGVMLSVPFKFGVGTAQAFANSDSLAKWIQPIRGLTALGDPSGIPCLTPLPDPVFTNTDYYQITVGEFTDVLHPDMGGLGLKQPTHLFGYWDTINPVKRHLGGVIIANRGRPVRIRFTNQLSPQHIIPVDTSVPGANQRTDRTATHLHGGLVPWTSDGGPFDWWAPNGVSGLSFLNGPGGFLDNITTQPMNPGQADYFYPNDQSTRLVWYHDHAHGITRVNAYAGIASAYLILGPDNAALGNKIPPLGQTIPVVFQDKIFVGSTTALTDPTWGQVARGDLVSPGALWYAHVYDPRLYKLLNGKKFLVPPNPSVVPEFFGDTMLCNGTVYPKVTVEAKRYRFLILNACNARVLNINLLEATPGSDITTDPKTMFAKAPIIAGPPLIQIGNEAGFLVKEVTLPNNVPVNPALFTGNLLMAPAERADVIVDFTGKEGKTYIMYNDAPGPFPVGAPMNDYFLGNKSNPIQPLAANTGPDTRNILQINVVAGASDPQPAGAILSGTIDPTPIVAYPNPLPAVIPPLVPPAASPVPLPAGPAVVYRNLTLNEDFDAYGRLRQLLGTTVVNPATGNFGIEYLSAATETPRAGDTEVWFIYNTTADTHPIHFHLVNVQVLYRQPFKITGGVPVATGLKRGPDPNEVGWKETVKMNPGELTVVAMKFELAPVPFNVPASPRTGGNEFVWHCHILEHEEHDMMRPLVVSGVSPIAGLTISPPTLTLASYAANAAGKIFTFVASNGIKPLTLFANDPNFPAVPTADGNGFSVTFPASPPVTFPYAANYTIHDSSNPVKNAPASINIQAV